MAATTSMQQHFGIKQTPLRTLNRGNNFSRASRNAVSVKRKSAVELLQESKSLYVKSETVLDRKQELKPSTPNAPTHSQCIGGNRHKENKSGSSDSQIPPMPPPKSPRLINLPQRRSTTSAPATCSDQLQIKLRRLLNADSKENLVDDVNLENTQAPRSICKSNSHPNERNQSKQPQCPMHHKSLPDLHTSVSSSSDQSDMPSYEYTTYNKSSEKSLLKSKSGDSMSLASSQSRKPSTCCNSSEISEEGSISSDEHSKEGYSSAFMVLGSPVKSCASYGSSTNPTNYRYRDSKDGMPSDKTDESYNWRPILRSKSDVGRRYTRLSAQPESLSPTTPPDLETFFEQLGLDSNDYNVWIKEDGQSSTSSPIFFSDTSTVDSANLCTKIGSQSEEGQNSSNNDLPSIVERNARIIKWLCNCRKLQVQASNSQNTPQRHTTLS